MEEKKSISIRKLATLERAKALGLPVRVPMVSAFECEAREWKRREEAEKSEVQGPKSKVRSPKSKVRSPKSEVQGSKSEVTSSMQNAEAMMQDPRFKTQYPVFSANEGFDWQPYRPEQDKPQDKPKNLNSASIQSMARKIMAREWAMALGRGGGVESEKAAIERKAEQFRQKKAVERERKEMEQKRAHKQREALEEALKSFGRALLKAPKPVIPETAETLLEEAFTDLGEFISTTWQEDGCCILIEPWEEKRRRRENGESLPAVFQATIDDDLKLISYQRVEDPHILRKTEKDIILKRILGCFRKSSVQDIHAFEDGVAEGGRIIQLKQINEGWKVKFEPWEEMRKRNIERKGWSPIVTYVIKADKNFNHISCGRI